MSFIDDDKDNLGSDFRDLAKVVDERLRGEIEDTFFIPLKCECELVDRQPVRRGFETHQLGSSLDLYVSGELGGMISWYATRLMRGLNLLGYKRLCRSKENDLSFREPAIVYG